MRRAILMDPSCEGPFDPEAVIDLLPIETVEALASMVSLGNTAVTQTLQLFGWGSRAVLLNAGAVVETGHRRRLELADRFPALVSAAADRHHSTLGAVPFKLDTSMLRGVVITL